MANSLNRNLKAGDKVVMLDGTVATCGGLLFGNMSFTSGSALDIEVNGERIKASGWDIDAAKTVERFGKQNGWEETPA